MVELFKKRCQYNQNEMMTNWNIKINKCLDLEIVIFRLTRRLNNEFE
jgi:hypothetical protein